MIKAHRVRLDPTNVQATRLDAAAHTARAAYNWGLSEWDRAYQAGNKPTQMDIRKQLNAVKRAQYPWMLDVTKCAPQEALIDLGRAFTNFFQGRARHPKYKKRGKAAHSFRVTNDQFQVHGRHIRLPKIGWVRIRETLRFTGKILSATISCKSGHWFASITVDTEDRPKAAPAGTSTGVDLGVSTYATLADGTKTIVQPSLKRELGRLRRLNRQLHRRRKGSRNRAKTKNKLAKLHEKVHNRRLDTQHKFTTSVARQYRLVGVEDLNVRGMMANHHLARSVADRGFYDTRRQLEYKTIDRDGTVVVVDRWFPSSKTCSGCGFKNHELTLGTRVWTCGNCGSQHDRDVNAAVNIRNEALRLVQDTAAGFAVAACGGGGSGPTGDSRVKPTPVKQELNTAAA